MAKAKQTSQPDTQRKELVEIKIELTTKNIKEIALSSPASKTANEAKQEFDTQQVTDENALSSAVEGYDKNVANKKLAASGAMAGAEVANLIINQAEFEGSFWLNRTGNYIAQRELGIAKQAVSTVSNVVGSTAIGFATGGWIGAIVGGVSSIANIAQNNINAEKKQQYQLEQMNEQLQFTRKRAGYAEKAGSIGEDL